MKSTFFILSLVFLYKMAYCQQTENVKDFGAVGDGITDDTKAIQSAIDAASPLSKTTIYFPTGIYIISSYTTTNNYLENYSLLMHSNLDFTGDGTKSIIKVGDHIFDKTDSNANAHLFYGKQIQNVVFSFLTIDLNGENNLVPAKVIKNHSAIFSKFGSNYYLHDITIKNCSGTNMINIMGKGNSLVIENCKFLNGGNYVGSAAPNGNQYDFSFVYSEWDSTIFKDNLVEQQDVEIGLGNNSGGLELHGSHSFAINNTFKGCWPAIFISSSNKGGQTDVTIENNTMSDCVLGVNFWIDLPMNNVMIANNNIELTNSRSPKRNICIGIYVPNGNAREYNNHFANGAPIENLDIHNNIITASPMQSLSAGMMLHSLENSKIYQNTIIGMNYSGIVLSGSKWGTQSLMIEDNTFKDFVPCPDKKTAGGYIVITDTYSKTVTNPVGFSDIKFSDNRFLHTNNNTNKNVKIMGAFIAVPSKSLSAIQFQNNYFSDSSENSQKIINED
jgi:Pectate lyase superfamily protein